MATENTFSSHPIKQICRDSERRRPSRPPLQPLSDDHPATKRGRRPLEEKMSIRCSLVYMRMRYHSHYVKRLAEIAIPEAPLDHVSAFSHSAALLGRQSRSVGCSFLWELWDLMVWTCLSRRIYAAGVEGLGVFLVAQWVYARSSRPGLTAAAVLITYGIGRFIDEFWRQPDLGQPVYWGWMSKGQLFSIPMIAIGAFFAFWLFRRGAVPKG